jgi:Concanavalin A-like lectin/glucanases superfamily
VLYYRLGDPPGSTTVRDSSGNGHDGVALGGVTFGQPGALPGDPDTSASFDGSTGVVNSGIKVPSSSSTIEAWIRPASSQCAGSAGCSAGQAAIAGTGGSFQLTFGRVPSHLIVWLWSLGDNNWRTLEAPTAIPLNTRTYVVTTWNGVTDQLSIYINGALDASVTLPGVTSSVEPGSNYNFTVGGFSPGEQPFPGGIDEVAYYSSALTPGRIMAHYQAATLPACTSPPDLPQNVQDNAVDVVDNSGVGKVSVGWDAPAPDL